MSVQCLTWVLDFSPAINGDRLVLISLANHADREGGGSYPPVPMIARESRMSDRAVQYALRSLEHGYEGSGRAIARDGVGPNRATLWRVLMDEQAKSFRGVPRAARGADIAPPEIPAEGAHIAPSEGANRVHHFAPSTVQNGAALNAHAGSSEPSLNRQELPPVPPAGDDGEQPDTAPPAEPSSRRSRDIEQRREELDAWLDEHPASAALQAELAPILDAARSRMDDGTFEIWLAPLHVHASLEGLIVLGTTPQMASWTADRFGALLTGFADRDVRVVGCRCEPDHRPATTATAAAVA